MSTIQVLFFALLFSAIVLFILFYDRIRKSKLFRKNEYKAAERAARKAAKEEEYFRRVSNKHYREDEKPKFKEDYFKGVDDAKEKKAEPKKETARRTTTSSDGVTIIDERQPTEKTASKEKKIFDDSEGEYVEFEEV
jgi:FtsZ-interacting cell division protein ZipA